MTSNFNIIGIFVNGNYVDRADTLEEAKQIKSIYQRFYNGPVTLQRGWHIPPSRNCMNASVGFPSASDREYRSSLIYESGHLI